ncbi:MAG TPA: nitroreductase [Sphingobium sp.]
MRPFPDRAEILDGLMKDRRSIRGFRADPVPQPLLDTIFATAQQAPSNCNAQPWVVEVVGGETAEKLRHALHAAAASGDPPSPDVPFTTTYEGEYRTRQIDSAKALFAATGVKREDTAARRESFLRNFRFFDAPHAAFLFMPEWAGWREAADCGMYAQSLMLALTAHGLGSCPQAALSQYAAIVHRELGVPENLRLIFGIAFGYEDTDHPANATRTVRAPLAETTIFHD